MSIPEFPGIDVETAGWGIEYNDQIFESDLNMSIQTGGMPGSRWVGSLTIPRLKGPEIRALKAFLASMKGRQGRFRFAPPDLDQMGTMSGSGVVDGSGQLGETISTTGWNPDQEELFLPNDYVQIGDSLHMITETIASDGSGNADLKLSPPVEVSPASGEHIVKDNPKAIMMLSEPDQARWTLTAPVLTGMVIDIMEANDA